MFIVILKYWLHCDFLQLTHNKAVDNMSPVCYLFIDRTQACSEQFGILDLCKTCTQGVSSFGLFCVN